MDSDASAGRGFANVALRELIRENVEPRKVAHFVTSHQPTDGPT